MFTFKFGVVYFKGLRYICGCGGFVAWAGFRAARNPGFLRSRFAALELLDVRVDQAPLLGVAGLVFLGAHALGLLREDGCDLRCDLCF